MNELQKYCYTEEVLIHIEAAQNELELLRALLGNQATCQSRAVWVRLQTFLTHVGMVSKLFFPPSGNKVSKQRGKDLQVHLGVDKTNPIYNREARDAIDHLDDRMDNWLRGDDRGFIESVYRERKDLDFLSPKRWAIRRAFIIDEFSFVVEDNGERKYMALEPIVKALEEIKEICIKKLEEDKNMHFVGK